MIDYFYSVKMIYRSTKMHYLNIMYTGADRGFAIMDNSYFSHFLIGKVR